MATQDLQALNDPSRLHGLSVVIRKKRVLERYYREIYGKYRDCLSRCPAEGAVIELGSGGGFAKEVLPEVITSDVIPYPNVDRVLDATKLDFPDNTIRAIFLLNVFHHIPDVAAFLREAERCLVPGGRVLIIDEHVGWMSYFILKYAHHEPFAPTAKDWKFESDGPLSGANGALAWIVFSRDRVKFEAEFPQLRLERYSPHTPFRYWLSGGLKPWCLLPNFCFAPVTWLERLLCAISGQFGSFVDIELVKNG